MDEKKIVGDDVRGKNYAGAATCISCHQSVVNGYAHNAHANTSRLFKDSLLNIKKIDSFIYSPGIKVQLEDGFVQTAYNGTTNLTSRSPAIIFGSGKHAYTFGYWQNKSAYQLPLSYFRSINGWANSPGFPLSHPKFDRPIIRGCFECHGSFIDYAKDQQQSLNKALQLDEATLITGIDCERCHGPAAAHVQFHSENRDIKTAEYLPKWNQLTRELRMDACGVCHSGNDKETQQTTFNFIPGNKLMDYYLPQFPTASTDPDVHGNQVQLLEVSKCFIQSKSLECSSCHSPHKIEFNYVETCQGCHKNVDHSFTMPQDELINKCIDCHMPLQASNRIHVQSSANQMVTDYLLRTHRIAIYPLKSN